MHAHVGRKQQLGRKQNSSNARERRRDAPRRHAHTAHRNADERGRAGILAGGAQRLPDHGEIEERPERAHDGECRDYDRDVLALQYDRAQEDRRT